MNNGKPTEDEGVDETDMPSFADMFDLKEIQRLQDAFSAATGVASIITDPEGIPITRATGYCSLCWDIIRKTEPGLSKCLCTDGEIGIPNPDGPRIQHCMSSGLLNGGTSIIVNGRHMANWIIGQIITEEMSEEELLPFADALGIDREVYLREIMKVNRMPAAKFKAVCDFLYINAQMLSKYAYETSQLSIEIQRRTEAEQNLQEANSQLEKWAEEKTTFLEEANCELTDLIHLLEEEVVEREKSQKLYKELSLELENRVAERTRELGERNIKRDEINALFTAIYDSSPDVIVFALDKVYRYISFNENHKKTMAVLWGKEITLGMSILDVIGNHEDAVRAKSHFDKALAGESFTRNSILEEGNAYRTHWQNHWSPVINPEGEIIGLSCFALNITDQIEAEEKLTVSEKLYSDIFHQSVIAVEIYDAEGILIDANEACLELKGVEKMDDLLGVGLFSNPNLDYDMKIRLLNQETVHFISDFDHSLAPYKTQHYGRRVFEWRIAPAVYKGRTTGYISQIQDVTERRRGGRNALRPKWQL